MDMKIYEPYEAHPLENGSVQKLYKFANGYGASVVKGEHTYGGDEGLWELAVIVFDTEGGFSLTYDTPITTDVEGHLTDNAVEELLAKVEALPVYKKEDSQVSIEPHENNDSLHKEG